MLGPGQQSKVKKRKNGKLSGVRSLSRTASIFGAIARGPDRKVFSRLALGGVDRGHSKSEQSTYLRVDDEFRTKYKYSNSGAR
jgi:hypothetical protein